MRPEIIVKVKGFVFGASFVLCVALWLVNSLVVIPYWVVREGETSFWYGLFAIFLVVVLLVYILAIHYISYQIFIKNPKIKAE